MVSVSQGVFWRGQGGSSKGFLSDKGRGHWINNRCYSLNPCCFYFSCADGLYSGPFAEMGILMEGRRSPEIGNTAPQSAFRPRSRRSDVLAVGKNDA